MEDQLKKCTICKKTDTNEFDFGPWMTKDDCTIHYFCAVSNCVRFIILVFINFHYNRHLI